MTEPSSATRFGVVMYTCLFQADRLKEC